MSVRRISKKFSVQSVEASELKGAKLSLLGESTEAYAGIPTEVVDEDIEAEDEDNTQLNLFEEDDKTLPPMSNWFGKLAAYTGGIEPTVGETKQLKEKQTKSCDTMLTALSMSAIATNGKVPAGGSYFMISRSIGPAFGGAVGILFYLGTTIASAMYLVGAVEVFLKYIFPQASLFGDITSDAALFNNTRVYGTILLFTVMCCVFMGIRFVSRFAAVSLAAVLISILCVYLGVFTVNPSRSPYVCALGGRLLSQDFITVNGTAQCHKNTTGPIYEAYCNNREIATEESCAFFNANNISYFPAMPGLTSKKFFENFFESHYREKGEAYDSIDFPADRKYGQGPNIADVTSSFMLLLGIYFPSVTGIMAGSNRSGDLTNPQKSIPLGTILAITMTFGESYGGILLVAAFAWPHFWVILIGSCLSTIGAGLQSLTGAPRLLQAIAQDNVMPFLDVFKVITKRGEPLRAQLLCYGIAQLGILIASIDHLTPLITMFFLMCYGFVNLASMLNGFLKEPSWRPRFRFYHWFLSFVGLCLCIALMFISSWYYTIVAWALAFAIYKYIEFRGKVHIILICVLDLYHPNIKAIFTLSASKEWGDATRGLQMSTAKQAILKLGNKPIHTKNWRPQILVYLPLDENFQARHDRLLDLVYQLKAGHGLTLVASILEGDIIDRRNDMIAVKAHLSDLIQQHRIKGLAEVLVASTIDEGMKNITADISAYVTQRTASIEQRRALLMQMKISNVEARCDPQLIVDQHRKPSSVDINPTDIIKSNCSIDSHKLLPAISATSTESSDQSPDHATNVTNTSSSDSASKEDTKPSNMKPDTESNNKSISNHSHHCTVSFATGSSVAVSESDKSTNPKENDTNSELNRGINEFTFSPSNPLTKLVQKAAKEAGSKEEHLLNKAHPGKITRTQRRLHCAVRLNELLRTHSSESDLVIVNMPGPSRTLGSEYYYMDYIETLTDGLSRILLVRGTGREVITAFSE
ncbi:solute carrier family 12 (potassium/chloride transporter), member 4/5/6 [Schistosoma bovis]|uniref:Solute carrier family 12 (Potassium/chloride transporter), member 4/5/6 n=1 Tax=Schistosoma bovis TaxID=6184 RepID=A0A430QCX6_SCHBO|nr:solute carrier family 12 (potassium/chloride transporter), member 4/5/6 [Schistosoma bovis]